MSLRENRKTSAGIPDPLRSWVGPTPVGTHFLNPNLHDHDH